MALLPSRLRNTGLYPVLAVAGEQGSAKFTFCAILRALIDRNTAPLRALPRRSRDLSIAANNGHFLAFHNVSHLSPWIADTVCGLAAGGSANVTQNPFGTACVRIPFLSHLRSFRGCDVPETILSDLS